MQNKILNNNLDDFFVAKIQPISLQRCPGKLGTRIVFVTSQCLISLLSREAALSFLLHTASNVQVIC